MGYDATESYWSKYSDTDDCDGGSSQGTSYSSRSSISKAADASKSRQIPVGGFLECTTTGSVVLSLELFPSPSGRNSSGKTLPFKSGDSGSDFGTPLADLIGAASKLEQWKVTSIRSKIRYTPEENVLLVDLKGKQGLRWERIKGYFPARSVASLQVHYSTKLRPKD